MKRYSALLIVAALALATGCGSSPASDRYIATEQSPEPSDTESAQSSDVASEQPAQIEEQQPQSESAQQTANPEAPPQDDKKEPADKPKKPEQKAQEAKKSNEAIGEAVTDSIMDNVGDPEAEESPKAPQLNEPIERIRSLVKDLKQHAENNDATQMKDVSSLLIKDWADMKADVNAAFPDMADFLEEKIAKLIELIKGESIDQQEMLQVDYELYQAFRQLADKAGVQG
ncbi:hypothetical protein [Cohnella yongneupensis]|uniref:Lipoprotein n=1 Tax=Cohnella yongneupensis TaxID=425006 RepID=A0ABW0QUV6_9BACL